jgi:predicted O-methyltransferase YrrM
VYPAIYWLESVLNGTEQVFEFGSGNSTLWFARRIASVVAIEHDERWANRLRLSVPHNVTLHYVPLGTSQIDIEKNARYVSAISEYERNRFDVVVVDGEARNACCRAAIPHLRSGGLLILDNSDRARFEPANQLLAAEGFARIDFTGPVPGDVGWSSTSVYARDLLAWTQSVELPTLHATKRVTHFGD